MSSRRLLVLPLFLVACGPDAEPRPVQPTASASAPPAVTAPPLAKNVPTLATKKPTTQAYFGTTVADDYAYLEDPKSPDVASFIEIQNAFYAKNAALYTDHAAIKERVAGLLNRPEAGFGDLRHGGTSLFVMMMKPPKQQEMLTMRNEAGEAGSEKVIVDPSAIDPSGKTTIDWFIPSPDGKTLAVSLSKAGSEEGDVHFFDVATAKEKGEVILHVQNGESGGSLVWNEQGNGVFYTRDKKSVNAGHQHVYAHKLGDAFDKDTYEIGKEFPDIAEIVLERSDDGKSVLVSVQKGDGGEFEQYVRTNGKWTRLSQFADGFFAMHFGGDGKIYGVTRKDASRGKVLSFAAPFDKATPVLSEGDAMIEDVVVTKSALYTIEVAGGPSRIRRIPLDGKPEPLASEPKKGKKPEPPTTIQSGARGVAAAEIPLLPISSVMGVERVGEDLLIRNGSYLEPASWYRYSGKDHKVTKTSMAKAAPVDMSDIEVVRETCVSKDGTKVPMSILRKKGTKTSGDHPALVTGYGGFGLARRPTLRTWWRVWLDQNGVIADTNLRGGNEFGEAWHDGGRFTKKQNVFDDFAACVKTMTTLGYTTPAKTALMGGSNGGLLMGATIVQHPDIARAVVAQVGIYDMLHYELTPNGAFNTTEYGSVKDETQFKALFGYSPFHNVKDNVPYPSVLFMTGANDPRVDPYNSRKMTARLQAATSGMNPIMLRVSTDTGHGGGTPLDAVVNEVSDELAFLFHELGVPFAKK